MAMLRIIVKRQKYATQNSRGQEYADSPDYSTQYCGHANDVEAELLLIPPQGAQRGGEIGVVTGGADVGVMGVQAAFGQAAFEPLLLVGQVGQLGVWTG
jgi:hypothetical protein